LSSFPTFFTTPSLTLLLISMPIFCLRGGEGGCLPRVYPTAFSQPFVFSPPNCPSRAFLYNLLLLSCCGLFCSFLLSLILLWPSSVAGLFFFAPLRRIAMEDQRHQGVRDHVLCSVFVAVDKKVLASVRVGFKVLRLGRATGVHKWCWLIKLVLAGSNRAYLVETEWIPKACF